MNVLFIQISSLTGLFVFLNQMWRYAPLEKSMFVAVATGLGIYVILMLADLSVRMIINHYPAREKRTDTQNEDHASKASDSASKAQSRPLSA